MSKVGFQDFWVSGARFYFKRDDVDSVKQPLIDFGVIQSASPSSSFESIKLFDADGGIKRKVDEVVTSVDEAYDITCNNFNMDNLALAFLSTAPEAFTQSATTYTVDHYAHAGRLLKITDSAGTALFSLSAVAGCYTGTVNTRTISGIVASTKTITVSSAVTMNAGDKIIVSPTGLANVNNASTYTVTANVVAATAIVVDESFAADETAITGSLIYKNGGTVYPKSTSGFEIVSLDRGIIRTNSPIADGSLTVVFATAALSGKRLLKPQAIKGAITGTGWLVYGRQGNADQTVREARLSLTPSSVSITADDFSNFVITASVLSNVDDSAAGRLIAFKGTLPSSS